MTIHLGYVPASSTVYVPFHTFNAAGASVTISGLAVTDIEIYKNGSVTQRSSDAGYALLDTDGIDFDSLTGIHGFSVDLSDNTDAGFYASGSTYWVVVSAVTVDSQTVSFVAATFYIGPSPANLIAVNGTSIATLTGAYPALGIAESGTMQAGSTGTTAVLRSATSFADDTVIGFTIWITGGTGVGQSRLITDWVSATDTATVATWTTTPDNTSTYIVFPTAASPANADITAILADTNELQTDWANGGRLDVILDARASQASVDTVDTVVDAILVDTGTTLDAALATVDTVVDAIKVQSDKLTNLPTFTAGGTGGQGFGAP